MTGNSPLPSFQQHNHPHTGQTQGQHPQPSPSQAPAVGPNTTQRRRRSYRSRSYHRRRPQAPAADPAPAPYTPENRTRISAQRLTPLPAPKSSSPSRKTVVLQSAHGILRQQFQRVALTMHPQQQQKKPGQDTTARKQSDRPFNVFSKQFPPCKTVKPAAEVPSNQRPRMVPYDIQHEDFMERLMD